MQQLINAEDDSQSGPTIEQCSSDASIADASLDRDEDGAHATELKSNESNGLFMMRSESLTLLLSRRATQGGNTGNSGVWRVRLEQHVRTSMGKRSTEAMGYQGFAPKM